MTLGKSKHGAPLFLSIYGSSWLPQLAGSISMSMRYSVGCIFRSTHKAVSLESMNIGLVKDPYLCLELQMIYQNFWYLGVACWCLNIVVKNRPTFNKLISRAESRGRGIRGASPTGSSRKAKERGVEEWENTTVKTRIIFIFYINI